MRAFPVFGRRWVRWSGAVFLATWVPAAGLQLAEQRAWADSRRLELWAEEMYAPTVLLGVVALFVGLLIDDLSIWTGRGREATKADPQATDYDDKPPAGDGLRPPGRAYCGDERRA
jgi:hypothetical protein